MRRVLAVVAAVACLGGCTKTVSGHPVPVRHYLSHTAVESYITSQLAVGRVACNGGRDLPLVHDGDKFRCRSAGRSFTVTITNARTGDYLVS